MSEKVFQKNFYLIAKYWLGDLEGFIKIGDNKEEIVELFKNRYESNNINNFGVTEESYQLLECNAKIIGGDKNDK